MRRTIAIRLEAYSMPEPNSGCYLWTGAVDSGGYGQLRVGDTSRGAHRLSWENAFGEVPSGLFVCHKCDVRSCVNPGHLFLGTAGDNNKDRQEKGRTVLVRGEAHGLSRMSEEQARIAKYTTERASVLAARFGVSNFNIYNIRNGRSWRHI